MIKDMLKLQNIRMIEEVADWKEAIHVSVNPLVEEGYVTENYEESIIRDTEKYGPYYVLAENLALVHARPEAGVIKKQLAITVVKKAVEFSKDSFPVRVLITLAATDSNSHLDIMRVLSSIFMDESMIQKMVDAEEPEQIYSVLVEAEKNLSDK